MKKVGIIIINWNSLRLGYAPDLVRSLNMIEYPKDSYTVFVADNGSDDGSPEYFEAHMKNVVVVRNTENLGFAEANNKLAARCAQEGYDCVYLLNHDTEVDPHFLRTAVEMLESDSKIGAVQSLLLLHQDKEVINSIGNAIHFLGFGFSKGGYEPLSAYPRKVINGSTVAYGSGAGVLLRLDVIAQTGLFNTHFFMYHEDLDLGWQIQLLGYRTVLAYDSVVYHKYEFSKSVQKYYYMERNRYIVLLENLRWRTFFLLFPFLLVFELGTLGFSFVSGFWRQKIRVYPYFLRPSSWVRIMKNRKLKQARRVVGDAEILKTFSGSIRNQHIDNSLLNKLVNPISEIYFAIVKKIVAW